jgi:acetyl-CoA C-acetyltransferase
MKANRYLHEHGTSMKTLAKMAAKNYRNGSLNPNAYRRKPLTDEQILASPMLNYALTQHIFCTPDDGAAAAIMCCADVAHRLTNKPVYVKAVEIRIRRYGAYEVNTTYAPVKEDVSPTVYAARAAFEKAGVAPGDVDVIRLQDNDSGLIANGEPIGASGLRRMHELVRQLRGEAGERQVAGTSRVGFVQVYGAPGTAAATILTT